jgi:hypothetical protein
VTASHGVSPPCVVDVLSAYTGQLIASVGAPYETCDTFAEDVGLTAQRLVVTTGTYCGSGKAFVFGVP